MDNVSTIDTSIHRETELAPPFLLRVGAAIIDYLALILLPVIGLLSDTFFAGGLHLMTDRTLWLIGVLAFLFNVVVLSVLFRRSLGKMLAGLTIVGADGSPANRGKILIRQTLGLLITLATGGLGFLVSVFSRHGRTFHDLLTGTAVVRDR